MSDVEVGTVLARGAFYGASNERFRIGDTLFEAVEDEDDGYRSMLENLSSSPVAGKVDGLFDMPVASVELRRVDTEDCLNGYHVVDLNDGHIWLRVGTDESCDWYPCFVFSYSPKEPTQ